MRLLSRRQDEALYLTTTLEVSGDNSWRGHLPEASVSEPGRILYLLEAVREDGSTEALVGTLKKPQTVDVTRLPAGRQPAGHSEATFTTEYVDFHSGGEDSYLHTEASFGYDVTEKHTFRVGVGQISGSSLVDAAGSEYLDEPVEENEEAGEAGSEVREITLNYAFAEGEANVGDWEPSRDPRRREIESDRYSDRFWRTDAEFTYRPLNLIHDFRLGFHVLRGEWSEVDGEAASDGRSPGMYYAHGEVNFELHRWFSLGVRPIIGVNAEGFVLGGGGVARIGDMTGTHLSLSGDSIGDVGYLADLRFHWATVPRFPMALGVEFTNWPASDESGDAANLSYDVGWEMTDNFTLALRLGTVQRDDSLNSGWQGRLALHYDL